MARAFQKLQELEGGTSQNTIQKMFSSHPETAKRIKHVTERAHAKTAAPLPNKTVKVRRTKCSAERDNTPVLSRLCGAIFCRYKKKLVNLRFWNDVLQQWRKYRKQKTSPVKRTVLDVDDIISVAPVLANHRKFVKWLMRVLEIDRVNAVHSKYFDTRGHHS